MTTFPVHDIASAPEGSRPVLEAAKQAMGSIPNLFGVFASSPALLKAYTNLAQLQETDGDFDETERQVLFLTISAHNGCDYCVAAHTSIADAKGVPREIADAIRDGRELPNPRLTALRSFATQVVEQRGWVDKADLESFFAAGFTARHALEVILAVAFKTISNFTNHVARTPLDRAFVRNAWSPTASTTG